jgi:hypothetical protein
MSKLPTQLLHRRFDADFFAINQHVRDHQSPARGEGTEEGTASGNCVTVTLRSSALLRRRVFAAGLLGVHAFGTALLMLQAGDARPGALLIVTHRDVQRAAAFAGELDLVAVHERIEAAMVGAGGQDVAGQ